MKPSKNITLRSKRLLLRQLVDEDIEHVFKGLSHPDIIKHYGVSYDTLEATKEQMHWYATLEKKEAENGLQYAL